MLGSSKCKELALVAVGVRRVFELP